MKRLRLQFIAGFLLVSPALCQYALQMDMRPDVTFGDHNDRFDITNLVEEQNHFENLLASNRRHRFKQEREEAKHAPEDSANEEDSLRRTELKQHHPRRIFARRYSENDFAYHDTMDSGEGGNVDFEKALDLFRANNGRRRLRNFVKYMRVTPKRRSLKKHAHRRDNKANNLLLRYNLPPGLKFSGLVKVPTTE